MVKGGKNVSLDKQGEPLYIPYLKKKKRKQKQQKQKALKQSLGNFLIFITQNNISACSLSGKNSPSH